MGDFAEKMENEFGYGANNRGRNLAAGDLPWYGDIGNLLSIKKERKCKEFSWFIHRFRDVYIDGGLVPDHTFLIKLAKPPAGGQKGQCLRYMRGAGTSPDGRGTATLAPCNPSDHRQRWHIANKYTGIRAWNTDQCIDVAHGGGKEISTYVCDISGGSYSQQYRFDLYDGKELRKLTGNDAQDAEEVEKEHAKWDEKEYRTKRVSWTFQGTQRCVGGMLGIEPCGEDTKVWVLGQFTVPIEKSYYVRDRKEHPEWFGNDEA